MKWFFIPTLVFLAAASLPATADKIDHAQCAKNFDKCLADCKTKHVDDAAAGEADREHIVIADTVSLQLCNAMAENLLAGGEDFGLDATAAHRTDHLT